MKKIATLFFLTALILVSSSKINATALNDYFLSTNAFLQQYVMHGKVDYKNIKANFHEIESLYEVINKMDLSSASQQEKKAFYINAYNLIVIYQVSKYYPLKSALDQSGFFDKVKHPVAGEMMTLNFLEIKKLILTYKDPRIHFALACAAVSCPPLASYSYQPDKLDKQLEDKTMLALNDPTWLKVASDKVELSKIFEWYKKDFTMDGSVSVLEFINKYRTKKIPSSRMVAYYEYDWSLNEH